MKRVSSNSKNKLIVFGGILILTIISGLSGCAPIPTPLPERPKPCEQSSAKMNIYKIPSESWAEKIFQYAFPALPTPLPPETAAPAQLDDLKILEARYATFQYLIKETKRWSDSETIKLDDSSEAQITVTFISPELIQAVYLSQVLKYRFFTSDFPTQIQEVLNSISARDELLFLVTVTTTNNGNPNSISHTIDIPISKMKLNNSEDLAVEPNHDDHNLEQPIHSSLEPVFGYLAYPLLSNNECRWILDPKFNTNIVLTVPNILMDGAGETPYTWTIPYTPLVNGNIPSEAPVYAIPPGFDTNLISTLAVPPNPAMNPNGTNPPSYWQDFARYVWNQVTLGNY